MGIQGLCNVFRVLGIQGLRHLGFRISGFESFGLQDLERRVMGHPAVFGF